MAKPRAAKKKAKKDPKKPPKGRKDWEENHSVISSAWIAYLREKKKRPTTKDLAKATGISVHTIRDHLAKLDTLQLIKKTNRNKILTDHILMGLAMRASNGYAQEVKLWLQITEGWVEKRDITTDGEPIVPIQMIVDPHAKKAIEKAAAKL